MTVMSSSGGQMSPVEALATLRPTPDTFRVWMPKARAQEVLRCAPHTLHELLAAGLCSTGTDVDQFDVMNISLMSGTGRLAREMVFFGRLLRSDGGDWVGPKGYTVRAETACPLGPDCTSDLWTQPSLPGVAWQSAVIGTGHAVWHGVTTLRGRDSPRPGSMILEAWRDVIDGFRFQFTPRALAERTDLVEQRRSGDCLALSLLLAERIAAVGLDPVVRHGYMFGGAALREHAWVSCVDVDGVVRDLDPAMALLAKDFFTAEFADFCAGSRLNRIFPLADERRYSVHHECESTHDLRLKIVLRAHG
jgi:hypothetical protein